MYCSEFHRWLIHFKLLNIQKLWVVCHPCEKDKLVLRIVTGVYSCNHTWMWPVVVVSRYWVFFNSWTTPHYLGSSFQIRKVIPTGEVPSGPVRTVPRGETFTLVDPGIVVRGRTTLERGTCHGESCHISPVSGRIPVSEIPRNIWRHCEKVRNRNRLETDMNKQ